MRNDALVVFKMERPNTFEACVIVFLNFATQHEIVNAFSEHQGVLRIAFLALTFFILDTVFNSINTLPFHFLITVSTLSAGDSFIFNASLENNWRN